MTSDVHSGASASDDKSIESEIKLDGSAVEEVGGMAVAIGFAIAVAVVTAVRAEDPLQNEVDGTRHLLEESDSRDYSDSGNDREDPSTDTPSIPAAQPIPDGVKMFGQCGGIFYTGNTACYDPDAYCKQLSVYSSICSPKPIA
ncbi:hypothetical protein BBO99_00008670 [Phytophthora kernoviae]|uniref:CBM1 domain-containing protein n=2 Tax=Phytophthora kernoviae TaxID=325452 RepID=A0A421FL49_9STRA|nr:hypothetical protein G195_010091 [Phytophthora kernoviae 00238/432]KAG2510673.1 hypothetical protein JM16_006985 [Phytophthora kernoviae]KAG2512905.1 hypothetical protein JM18_006888 [Phytophthora kernoviae]RLN46531.1 hypothetical protein BBI17_008551 [Phytophthora kernoviae]RLN74912.1 hypothetical protein BBO99_00008670 [Phytophthora kernoviae]